ncbi:MAG: biotin--[acetyl-CoA-carboxylase] ligase [Rickettsiaceae bacterium]|nr:biotin--[acetyl-CoA-carboxylase] ligase [Rickettsiaceae bacterium]
MMNSIKWLDKFHLLLLDEVDSTSDEAKRIAATGQSPDFLVVCAKRQTNGRGRYKNIWESYEGNLFMSIIVPTTHDLDAMAQLSFVTSLALENAISSLLKMYNTDGLIQLKWPNDILLNDHKIAGILLETGGLNNNFIVIGVGVNICRSPLIADKKITDLYKEGLVSAEKNEIMNRFMSNFSILYANWLEEGFLPIRDKWLKKAKGIGKIISINTGSSRISGKFLDIDFKGQARIGVSSGQVHSVNTGEIFFSE